MYDLTKCFDGLWLEECCNNLFEAGVVDDKPGGGARGWYQTLCRLVGGGYPSENVQSQLVYYILTAWFGVVLFNNF